MEKNTKLEQLNVRSFDQMKRNVEKLFQHTNDLSDNFVSYMSSVNGKLDEINSKMEKYNRNLSVLKKDIKSIEEKYYDLCGDVKDIVESVENIKLSVISIDKNNRDHDFINYDIMQKMLSTQQALIENVINLLEAHSIIDHIETTNEIYSFVDAKQNEKNSLHSCNGFYSVAEKYLKKE